MKFSGEILRFVGRLCAFASCEGDLLNINCAFQFCNEYAVPKEHLEHFKDVTAQDIICSQVIIVVHSGVWSKIAITFIK
jgi:hypothetical protein